MTSGTLSLIRVDSRALAGDLNSFSPGSALHYLVIFSCSLAGAFS
jgi:hypothetical protein